MKVIDAIYALPPAKGGGGLAALDSDRVSEVAERPACQGSDGVHAIRPGRSNRC